jgi:hypothetical protein
MKNSSINKHIKHPPLILLPHSQYGSDPHKHESVSHNTNLVEVVTKDPRTSFSASLDYN